jgi:predicted MFS family arabinose efflux permease
MLIPVALAAAYAFLLITGGAFFLAAKPIAAATVILGGLPSLLQTRLLHTASVRIRDVASAYLTTSFNIGIGGGALVGGLVLDRYGVGSLPWVDLGITLLALVVILVTDVWLRRRELARRHA